MSLVTITPTTAVFYRNDLRITNIFDENESFKNGLYVATSSSFHDMDTLPFNVFNDISNNKSSWVCAGKNNSKFKYSQNPYSGAKPSTYIGGGNKEYMWKTIVDGEPIFGEWIQIQIPYKILVSQFSIMIGSTTNAYPKLFYLVGSNNDNDWSLLGQVYLRDLPYNMMKSNRYDVKSTRAVKYIRLIISELFEGTVVNIKQFGLKGYQNIQGLSEGFTDKISPTYITGETRILANKMQVNPTSLIFQPFSKYEIDYTSSKASGLLLDRKEGFSDYGYTKGSTIANQYNDAISTDFDLLEKNKLLLSQNQVILASNQKDLNDINAANVIGIKKQEITDSTKSIQQKLVDIDGDNKIIQQYNDYLVKLASDKKNAQDILDKTNKEIQTYNDIINEATLALRDPAIFDDVKAKFLQKLSDANKYKDYSTADNTAAQKVLDESDAKIDDYNDKITDTNSLIAAIKSQIDVLNVTIVAANNKIKEVQDKIDQLTAAIASTQKIIENTQKEILRLQLDINRLYGLYSADIALRQISPLKLISQDYSAKLKLIDTNTNNLNNKTTKFMQMRDEMLNDKNDYYQYNGKVRIQKDEDSLLSALNDDYKSMAVSQNMMYVLATITIATLAVGAIVLSRN